MSGLAGILWTAGMTAIRLRGRRLHLGDGSAGVTAAIERPGAADAGSGGRQMPGLDTGRWMTPLRRRGGGGADHGGR